MRRIGKRLEKAPRLLVLGAALALLAGCGFGKMRDVGLGDRCAEMMQRAFPGAKIEATKKEATASMATATARVEAVRTDVPEDGVVTRDLAAECKFENNILTSFRWTAGPLH